MSGARPTTLLAVVGTGTEIGKTWISARLLERCRRAGHTAAARKPAQSFSFGEGPTDAEVLAAATGGKPEDVCPPWRCYAVAMAPPMAAKVLGQKRFTLGDLVAELRWPYGCEIGLVETAGGLRSPQADDGDALDLVRALSPSLTILVADAGLGTIHGVRSAADELSRHGVAATVVLNRFDPHAPLHAANLEWLTERCGYDVVAATDAGLDALAARIVALQA
ncbi:MAG: ATP-dependent dethiobiotin synthetase BioD [Acidimicrobiales bacterium]